MTDGQLRAVSPLTIGELFDAHDNAEAVRKIRVWCDRAVAMDCQHVSEDMCRRREVIKDCAAAVRSLLPAFAGEDGGASD
jgi:hypothetical protein